MINLFADLDESLSDITLSHASQSPYPTHYDEYMSPFSTGAHSHFTPSPAGVISAPAGVTPSPAGVTPSPAGVTPSPAGFSHVLTPSPTQGPAFQSPTVTSHLTPSSTYPDEMQTCNATEPEAQAPPRLGDILSPSPTPIIAALSPSPIPAAAGTSGLLSPSRARSNLSRSRNLLSGSSVRGSLSPSLYPVDGLLSASPNRLSPYHIRDAISPTPSYVREYVTSQILEPSMELLQPSVMMTAADQYYPGEKLQCT